MSGQGGQGEAPGDAGGLGAAASALAALVPPLRFAARRGFAGVGKLAGFGATVRAAVENARAAGAGDTPALRRLLGEAEGFDALPLAERKRAVARIVADVAALIPVPEELREVARAGRVEVGAGARAAAPAKVSPSPRPSPPQSGGEGEATPPSTPTVVPDPRTPAERSARRKLLQTPLADVPKAHPAPRGLLEERDRRTVESALEFLPRAYEDRSDLKPISSLRTGDEASVLGTVLATSTQRMRNGRPILKAQLTDGRAGLELVFFNAPPWKAKQLVRGESLLASGKVTEGFGAKRQMTNPEVERVSAGDSANFGRIVPIYPGPAGWQHPALRKLVKRLCDEYAPHAVDDLPAAVRERRALLPRAQALREVHFPPPGTDLGLATWDPLESTCRHASLSIL